MNSSGVMPLVSSPALPLVGTCVWSLPSVFIVNSWRVDSLFRRQGVEDRPPPGGKEARRSIGDGGDDVSIGGLAGSGKRTAARRAVDLDESGCQPHESLRRVAGVAEPPGQRAGEPRERGCQHAPDKRSRRSSSIQELAVDRDDNHASAVVGADVAVDEAWRAVSDRLPLRRTAELDPDVG